MSSLKEVDVGEFLVNNPKYLPKWFSKHGTTALLEELKTCEKSEPLEKISEKVEPKMAPFSGGRNSITTNIFKSYLEGQRQRKQSLAKKDRNKMLQLNEKELFMELIRDVASELDVNVLCHKILQNVSILTNSDRGSLFLTRGHKDNKFLVSKLFDVTETSTLAESIHTEEQEIKVPFGKGIAGHVALSKEIVNIKDAYEDPRFNKEVDKKTGYRTHSILCMPIINYDGDVIGVAQIINKVSGDHEFTENDIRVFRDYLTFCGIGITNAQLFEMSVQEFKRNQMLLSLARGIFEEQDNLDKLCQKIMLDAQDLLKCERCSVYLIKFTGTNIMFTKAYNLYEKDKGNIHVPSLAEVEKSKNAEIATFVITKNRSVNISDLELDGSFGNGPFVDDDGFITRSILCMPIYDSDKKIIGVTQLINKLNGMPFNDNDFNIIEAFSIFFGLGIHNCQMYENTVQLMAKQKVALEVLSYHATAPPEEVVKFTEYFDNTSIEKRDGTRESIPTAKELELYSFEFSDLALSDDGTVKATLCMFMEAGIFEEFRVPFDVVVRWTLSVKKNYRPVTYHNWRHAFNVTQSMFTILYTGALNKDMSKLEIYTLLAACLCHDLDHRGTNNAFQVKTDSALAMLYSTSVMEHHHFDHCIMILNSTGNNIFETLSADDYRTAIKMLEHAILSTDLALYFRKRGQFKDLVENGNTNFEAQDKRDLLKAMMMTACDVAAICKPWPIQQAVATLVSAEFFEQGDIEKTELGEKPMAMMDREKKDELPKMQVGFIDAICLPIYKLFYELNEGMKPLYDGCVGNRQNWQQLADEQDEKHNEADMAYAAKTAEAEKQKEAASKKASQTMSKQSPILVNKQRRNTRPGQKPTNQSPKKVMIKESRKQKSNFCVIQ